jgi:dTDP-L-rhamnose 4-epimerase
MRVRVTGSAGFIGRATHDELVARGHEVVGLDALLPAAHGPGAAAPEGTRRADVRAPEAWRDLLAGVDAVCHLAAMVGAGTSARDLPAYAAHNDLGTATVLAAMHEAGVRALVQASSMVVYGEGRYRCERHGVQRPLPRRVADLDDGRFENRCGSCGSALGWELVDEDAPLDPRSAYAASKVAQEHYAAAWARQSSGTAVSLRFHNVYGPGMPRDTPYSGVAALFRSALEAGRRPAVFEDGGQVRDFVHVTDVARATALALEAAGSREPGSHAAYNVCSGVPVSILEVATRVARGAERWREPRVTGEYRLGDVRHVVASPERAREELGFTARVHPRAGLAAFARDPLRA